MHVPNYAAPSTPWGRVSDPYQHKNKRTTVKVVLLFSSGKRDSDPRPRPWQGRALPTELFPRGVPYIEINFSIVKGIGQNNEFFGAGVGKRGKGIDSSLVSGLTTG